MSSSEDKKKREAAVQALRDAPTAQDKNARAGIVKQKVRESFIFKLLNGQEQMSRLGDYIDMWTPESMMQLHDFLGFSEKEWLMIVADQRAYPFIVQERAFNLGKIPMTQLNRFNYQKLLEELAPRDGNIEAIVKSAMDPTAVFQRLVQTGVIDRSPNHLFVHYKAYGWMTHKLFIDLNDVVNLRFRWDVLNVPQVSPAPADKVEVKQIEAVPVTIMVEIKTPEDVTNAAAVVDFVKDEMRKGLDGFIGQPAEKTDEKKS